MSKPTGKSSNTNPFMSLWSKRSTVFVPKTNQQVSTMLFEDYKESIMRIGDDMYSICLEYTDISFAKADLENAGTISLKWVDYLNSLTDKAHIQVTNASTPVNTKKYRQQFIYDEKSMVSEQERHLAHELNTLIDDAIGKKKNTLITKKYVIISQKALNYEDAKAIFSNIYRKTEKKFKDLKSSIRIVPVNERLTLIYDFWNIQAADEKGTKDFEECRKEKNLTIYDVLAPHEYINLGESNYIEIAPQDVLNSDTETDEIHRKRFIRCLYIEPDFPNAITPKFYSILTTIEDLHLITTIDIQLNETTKIVKKLSKLQSGLEAERYNKVKQYTKQ